MWVIMLAGDGNSHLLVDYLCASVTVVLMALCRHIISPVRVHSSMRHTMGARCASCRHSRHSTMGRIMEVMCGSCRHSRLTARRSMWASMRRRGSSTRQRRVTTWLLVIRRTSLLMLTTSFLRNTRKQLGWC